MIALIQTVFPEPVDPATNRCGILVRSATRALPLASLPRTIGISAPASAHALDWRISFRQTGAGFWFGTSIPTQPLPGTGANIRTLSAFNAIAKFLSRLAIFSTRTPAAGCTSYRVITGPVWTSPNSISTLNWARVSLRFRALIIWSSSSLASSSGGSMSSSNVGKW